MVKKVTIYSTPWCVYCKMAKKYFNDNKVAFVEHDVAQDEQARDEMIKKTGQMGVPVIEIDGQIVIGFDQQELKKLLGV
ncbi:NrdH-redoxin [Candidatus Giovannonibacteria bacterium RIFCSPHIGHO2_02_43_13]|uniref:NrdH-redoxin n=1 Tax=Candidatus Giovannonibacteria bacterium RIFCSPHIGHO2_02_43_13 TaxID=1798330 RepID=A0A1F5WV09_9BACT|nr:MAG: Glutaredoxin-like protein, YruB-family [Parcubacteria group bacterium GW2011_GWA2_44_13]OGF71948.1 MAG: NrdH-redoxin [Candidatus Giovannonibacteria bacterium RIFCSPHIGHO2_12_FULL_44_42]OGF79485.1 MAG: NrdH-redoxin [Candidatus Giovannonibacteria bacterium RIFCSPHIGHO2_02_43_13]OGF89730.1 MAG: NrdH-redoxin [Candidatus Giovannonibacteria bacterium RIFCSPLOWO2_02_FULL_43_54]OGF96564.1 MAG: NrdH-redoxin [Candidatus Giovannonibacteria bacterium RIFCSPLOWO2_12_FULL_44_32]